MGEVIQFPVKPNNDWLLIENTIKEILNEANASEVFIKHVTSRMQVAWKESEFVSELSIPCSSESEEQIRGELKVSS